jgi:hypothetical protein
MAPSTGKRRKISPTTSAPATLPDTPSRIPVPRNAGANTPSRPSFASPTKASIAKHNPQLLEKYAATGEPPSRSNAPPPPTETLFLTQSTTVDTEVGSEAERDVAQGVLGTEHQSAVPSIEQPVTEGRMTRSARGGLAAPPRRMSRTPGREVVRRPVDPSNDEINQNIPRPVIEVQDPVDPFRRAGLRRSPVLRRPAEPISTSNPDIEKGPEEPELPPTPVQLGIRDPVVTTPPSGIHDTPSKKSKRRKGMTVKMSPLKPRSELPTQTAKAMPEAVRTDLVEGLENRNEMPRNPSRLLLAKDPHAGKKRIREELLREIQQLRADVLIAEKESERLRVLHASGEAYDADPPNYDEVLQLLLRSSVAQPSSIAPKKPPSVFDNINSFLPFTARRRIRPEVKISEPKPLVSHNPFPQEDALSYLQLFTPFKFTSSLTLLPPTISKSGEAPSAKAPLFQSHTITASLPSGLFSARLNMVVNTKTLAISSLNLEKVDRNAEAELAPWIRARASTDTLLGRDVNAVFCAVRQWAEQALERAKFWCNVEAEMGTADGRRKVTSIAKAKGARKRKRKDGRAEAGRDLDEDEDAIEITDAEISKWERKQLLAHMSRTSMILEGDDVELMIEWRIGFDWTGEAESQISASARIPPSCQFGHSLIWIHLTDYIQGGMRMNAEVSQRFPLHSRESSEIEDRWKQ